MKTKLRVTLLIPLLLVMLAPVHVPAASQMYLKIDGVDGESTDKTHSDEIEVLSWSWGMSTSITPTTSTRPEPTTFQALSITKYIDKATPKLMLAASTVEPYDQAILTLRRIGENPAEYLTITMNRVYVTSLSTGGSAAEDRMTETVKFIFETVEVEYVFVNPDGSTEAPITYGFDLSANTPL